MAAKITGILDTLEEVENISVEEVSKHFLKPPEYTKLQNFLANRILYPQAVAFSSEDIDIDRAILCEALKKTGHYFNINTRKIVIPKDYLDRFPDFYKLVKVFLDAYMVDFVKKNIEEDVWFIVLRGEQRDENVGSVIKPNFFSPNSVIKVKINGKNILIKKGELMIIPCNLSHCIVEYSLENGTFLGNTEGAVSLHGGSLGIVIDGRSK